MEKSRRMYIDLHVHTTISSCSQLTPEQILALAGTRGLDGVCITDHQSMAAAELLREGVQENGLCVIIGMEYETESGDFLLFGPFEDLPGGLSAEDLLPAVDKAGGVAVAAHPRRPGRSVDEALLAGGLCRIIEGINGRNADRYNREVADWSERYNIRQVGGSDSHTPDELGRIATQFDTVIRSRSDLIRALKTGGYRPVIPRSAEKDRRRPAVRA
jgi:hypothetical protein